MRMFWLSMSKRPLHLVSVTRLRHRHPKICPPGTRGGRRTCAGSPKRWAAVRLSDLTADTKKNIPRIAMRMDVPGSNRCKWSLRCRS
ncbi:protein of unknown function [Azospirillum baldaniorum]|uniref:Uncharacterized protein n=1 Tax=Azospirillum baldaniorum TaxID=1064539 RepID=A0A9P1JSG0_9PROT|nr:protein of unknown function [Azospirillum baldaniorum]